VVLTYLIGIGYGPSLTKESFKVSARASLRVKLCPNNYSPSYFSKLKDFIFLKGRIVFLLLEAAEAEQKDYFEIALTSDFVVGRRLKSDDFVIGRRTSVFKSY
jgi:hypothetical protein